MKGIVFTEFLEMVEAKFGDEMVDKIIDDAALPSDGVYTAIGTYDHQELLSLVALLSEYTQLPIPQLVEKFGHQLFGQFLAGYPGFFSGINSALDFLANVENYIHVEVLKLYPDAELPTFEYDRSIPGALVIVYRSTRPFASLALGLIKGCIEHFGEEIELEAEDLSFGKGTAMKFTLVKQG
ncbi:heme NO-binding domain-containing protein [Candidatus Methylobacter oryzae]|uniref:Heme NO-binding domain-containing protein n=1 Tax=Candidatus Methylobacter oryzae TaxID=2497749 RepID=A0ABY3CBT4_9GAMM|nr:heme NO-binding domain-containing protein [Candidatus Methylobacter oryzae]TRW95244.1 hypothetical protein EKO24_010180 [Candidatus Methylobacter oryzae]